MSKDYAQEPASDTIGAGGRPNKLSTYVMNGAVCGYAGNPNPNPSYRNSKITDAFTPVCYLLWEPDEYLATSSNPQGELNFEWNDGSNYLERPQADGGDEEIGRLHDKNGGNILALDGHVDFMVTNTFTKISLGQKGPFSAGGKNTLWWSPFSANGH